MSDRLICQKNKTKQNNKFPLFTFPIHLGPVNVSSSPWHTEEKQIFKKSLEGLL